MIGYLQGTVLDTEEKSVILLVNQVGYAVYMPEKDLFALKPGMELALHTELVVRENEMVLYGFLDPKEKTVFRLLNEVSGIGPRSSLSMLSSMDSGTLCHAIVAEDLALLVKLPGIGKKTAQRLVLELKEKIIKTGTGIGKGSLPEIPRKAESLLTDTLQTVLDTLEALGYSDKEVLRLLPVLEKDSDKDAQELVKIALRLLSEK